MTVPLLDLHGVSKSFASGDLFRRGGPVVRAVQDVSFSLARGEIVGLVGESGSGKTTIGRTIMRLNTPDAGSIRLDGQEIAHLTRRQLRPVRQQMQMVFQDPFASLNPRMTAERIVGASLAIHGLAAPAERRDRVQAMLERVGLSAQHMQRYPHEFSGGQRQRLGIARALISQPGLIVADEPVAALDVSVQAQIVNLLLELSADFGLTILFITHDLAVVGRMCDRVAVMYLGRIVELAPTPDLFRRPAHPYTEALLSAIPLPEVAARRTRIILAGGPPSPADPPSGCAFRTRCRYALPACAEAVPSLRMVVPGHLSACIRDDLALSPF
jgi:oligopeptide/dipeptide ABC transporter ATP-binding protein